MKQPTEMNTYAQMGMAALLPGMQYGLEIMQQALDEMRGQLALWQNGAGERVAKRGRPPKVEGLVSMAGLKPGSPEWREAKNALNRIA